jgi:CheY-like chemotaxis protein
MAKILVVDDEKDSCFLLQVMLELDKHEVVTANNGEEAIDKLKEFTPELVITDVCMPKMDGYELCYHIRQDERTKKIPVLLLTAVYPELTPKILPVVEANAFMIKPYEPVRLMDKIKELLGK